MDISAVFFSVPVNIDRKENRLFKRAKMASLLELIKAIFLGIPEEVAEWLPISSTGTVEHWNSVSQSAPILKGDVDNSGTADPDDAIYLLYHVNFPSSYPLH